MSYIKDILHFLKEFYNKSDKKCLYINLCIYLGYFLYLYKIGIRKNIREWKMLGL